MTIAALVELFNAGPRGVGLEDFLGALPPAGPADRSPPAEPHALPRARPPRPPGKPRGNAAVLSPPPPLPENRLRGRPRLRRPQRFLHARRAEAARRMEERIDELAVVHQHLAGGRAHGIPHLGRLGDDAE